MDFKSLMGDDGSSSFASRATTTAIGMSGDKGCLPSLSVKTRLIGFVTCFSLGQLLSLLSTIYLFSWDAINFSVLYTLGNILALSRYVLTCLELCVFLV